MVIKYTFDDPKNLGLPRGNYVAEKDYEKLEGALRLLLAHTEDAATCLLCGSGLYETDGDEAEAGHDDDCVVPHCHAVLVGRCEMSGPERLRAAGCDHEADVLEKMRAACDASPTSEGERS